jgi:hypothetical protein
MNKYIYIYIKCPNFHGIDIRHIIQKASALLFKVETVTERAKPHDPMTPSPWLHFSPSPSLSPPLCFFPTTYVGRIIFDRKMDTTMHTKLKFFQFFLFCLESWMSNLASTLLARGTHLKTHTKLPPKTKKKKTKKSQSKSCCRKISIFTLTPALGC